MLRDARTHARRAAKKAGQAAAKLWWAAASHEERVQLAGCGFEYGMTLDTLLAKGVRVPASEDIDFSWGFFKQAKSRVYTAIHKSASAGLDSPEWDIFISHAHEDKPEIAEPLARRLQERGLKVWYDTFALKLGMSLRRSIDTGLSRSRFGVVILSPAFLRKQWPQKELDGLVGLESQDGRSRVLPVWHKLTATAVRKYSPTLADKVAIASDRGLDAVTDAICAVVQGKKLPASTPRRRSSSPQEAKKGHRQ